MKAMYYVMIGISILIPFWMVGIIAQAVERNGFDVFFVGAFIMLGAVGTAGCLGFAHIFKKIVNL